MTAHSVWSTVLIFIQLIRLTGFCCNNLLQVASQVMISLRCRFQVILVCSILNQYFGIPCAQFVQKSVCWRLHSLLVSLEFCI